MNKSLTECKRIIEECPINFDNHIGFQKLNELIKDNNLNYEESDIIITQYKLLVLDSETSLIKSDEIYKYIVNTYPQIVSIIDMLSSKNPFIRCIWTFDKENEYLVERALQEIQYENYKKYNIDFNNKDILVIVINIDFEYNYDESEISVCNNAYEIARKKGYLLFDKLKQRMVAHGMCWYTYTKTAKLFSNACHLLPVRKLVLNYSEETWSKEGYRNDLDYAFRSSWEANIARILNYKNIKWKYEPGFINLEPPKYITSNTKKCELINYLPDFVLADESIIEVKGFWDLRSKLKVSQLIEQCPDINLIVIDADIYNCIENKYKSIIPNWEYSKTIYTTNVIQIVGITIPQRKRFVSKLNKGDKLNIIREPDNPYDNRAIKVVDEDGNQIGYFAKDWSCIYASKIDLGFKYSLTVLDKKEKYIQGIIEVANKDELILPEIFR